MTPEKFQSKFLGNKEAKTALLEYYSAFKSSKMNGIAPNSDTLFNSEFGWTLGPAGIIARSKDMDISSSRFAKLVTKMMGARQGDERELVELIQEEAHDALIANNTPQQYQKAVVQHIANNLAQEFELFLPNPICSMSEQMKPIKIGTVRILTLGEVEKETQKIIQRMANPNPNLSFLFDQNDATIQLENEGMRVVLPSAPIMWAIEAVASKTHLREEALWQIGVAISLMRLRSANWDSRIPGDDEIEPNPTSRDQFFGANALTRIGGNLSAGGSTLPSQYDINAKVAADMRRKSNQNLFDNIFGHRTDTIGERTYNALGWLAKGRQAHDRSERLLYFFTAIETILTRADKHSPVVDTISRHGAVAIARTIKDRPRVAQRFKYLYDFRSATVHRGARYASALTVKEAHFLAHLLVAVVLRKCDMAQSHSTFCNNLAKSSYGTKWPS